MIYITARHPHGKNVISIEVKDEKLVPAILKMLMKDGYDTFEIKGWVAE